MFLQKCFLTVIVCTAACVFASGCGGGTVPLARVAGTVTYNGQPLKQGAITFLPAKGPSANGKIVDGKIVDVSVLKKNDGVPLGNCKITIVCVDRPEADMYTPKTSLIPERYNQVESSGLSADIKSGTNTLTLELKD